MHGNVQDVWRELDVPTKNLVSAPTQLVSTADAKLYLKIDNSAEDSLVDALVQSATDRLEKYCNRVFATQTWDFYLDNWPRQYKSDLWWDGVREGAITQLYADLDEIEVPITPIQSVTHIKYYAIDGTEYTFSTDNYNVDSYSSPPRIKLAYGATWHSAILRTINAVEIRVVAGYSSVPSAIVQAVKELLGHLYEHRGDESVKLPSTPFAMVNPYRVMRV